MEVLCINWKGKLAAVAKDVPTLCAAVGWRVPSSKVALKQTWGKFDRHELHSPNKTTPYAQSISKQAPQQLSATLLCTRWNGNAERLTWKPVCYIP